MAEGIFVDASDYQRMLAKLKTIDKKVAAAYRKRLRYAAVPIGRLVLERGAEQMPHRGGLADRITRSKVAASVRGMGADVWLGKRNKSQISRMNKGSFRKPVFADALNEPRNDWTWVDQPVPAMAFSEALKGVAPEAAERMRAVVTDIMKELEL